jgi:hypothetical protein
MQDTPSNCYSDGLAPSVLRQTNSHYLRFCIGLLVVFHVSLCAWGAWCHSPTVDEIAYLPSGLSHWEFGRFDLCQVSPPLVRLAAALPVRFAKPQYDWSGYHVDPGIRAEHNVGASFLIANGERSFWLFTLGRWSCIPFSLIGAWASYRWAKELFGSRSAMAALLLWCISPNILAHAQLLTPDIGVTALSLAACHSCWRWSQSPTWLQTFIVGGFLGLAVLAKTNAVALYPALFAGISLHAGFEKRLRTRTTVVQGLAAFLFSIYVINLGYGFDESFKPLGKYEFFSKTFCSQESSNRFRSTILEDIPVPLPASFLEGIDLQRRDFENSNGTMQTYFRGRWYDHGWWWYYAYAVAVKTPIGTWILTIVGGVTIFFVDSRRRIDTLCYIIVPGMALFALPCSQTGFSHSLRYVLPAFPFAFVIASAAMCQNVSKWLQYVSVAALTWTLASSLYVFPHSLSYFNEIVGGPRNGSFHLLDGNVDWGQDLFYVVDWMNAHPKEQPICMAYWGFLPLTSLGIHCAECQLSADSPIPSGWYLVSVNFLRSEYRLRRPEYEQFLNLSGHGYVGYATRIYYVPGK